MARKDGGFLKGVIGPVITCEVNGQQVIQSKSQGTNQTDATKNAGLAFGVVSTLAREIRHVFERWTKKCSDGGSTNRLNRLLNDCLMLCRDRETQVYRFETSSFEYLTGLEFNEKSPLYRSLGFLPEVKYDKGTISCTAPDFQRAHHLVFPMDATSCDITVAVATLRLGDAKKTYAPMYKTLEINDKMEDMRSLKLDFEVPDGCLCIVAMFLSFYTNHGRFVRILNDTNFGPGKICGAFMTPGTYKGTDSLSWMGFGSLDFGMEIENFEDTSAAMVPDAL